MVSVENILAVAYLVLISSPTAGEIASILARVSFGSSTGRPAKPPSPMITSALRISIWLNSRTFSRRSRRCTGLSTIFSRPPKLICALVPNSLRNPFSISTAS